MCFLAGSPLGTSVCDGISSKENLLESSLTQADEGILPNKGAMNCIVIIEPMTVSPFPSQQAK